MNAKEARGWRQMAREAGAVGPEVKKLAKMLRKLSKGERHGDKKGNF